VGHPVFSKVIILLFLNFQTVLGDRCLQAKYRRSQTWYTSTAMDRVLGGLSSISSSHTVPSMSHGFRSTNRHVNSSTSCTATLSPTSIWHHWALIFC